MFLGILLAILSGPFWFFGIVFWCAAIAGTLTVNEQPATGNQRIGTIVVSSCVILFAYFLATVGF